MLAAASRKACTSVKSMKTSLSDMIGPQSRFPFLPTFTVWCRRALVLPTKALDFSSSSPTEKEGNPSEKILQRQRFRAAAYPRAARGRKKNLMEGGIYPAAPRRITGQRHGHQRTLRRPTSQPAPALAPPGGPPRYALQIHHVPGRRHLQV